LLFLTDAMFGKLGIYLRLLGFDVGIAANSLSDKEVFKLAQAEHRILLTRDKGFYAIVKTLSVQIGEETFPAAIFIDEKRVVAQIEVVFRKFSLNPELLTRHTPAALKSRCAKCNSPISAVDKSKVKEIVPNGTYEKIDNYWQCTNPECNTVYWIGRHWVSIERIFAEVKKNLSINKK
jgi:uncharacterized protein